MIRCRRRRKSGQAIVEMAVLFPFFLLIIVGGIIDFGFAFYNFLSLQQIANNAAQFAAEGKSDGLASPDSPPNDAQVIEFITSKKPQWWTGTLQTHPIISVTTSDGLAQIKKVYITYESPVYTPFYQTMLGSLTGNGSIRLTVLAAYQRPLN